MSLGDIPMGKGAGSDKSTSPETSEDERPPPAKKEPIRDSDRSRPSAQPAQPPRPAPAPEPKPDEPVPQPGFKRPAGASGFDYTSAPPAAPRPQYTAPSQPAPPRQAPAQAAPPPASSYAPPPPASQPPPLPMPPHLAQRPVSPRRSPTAAPPTAVEEEMLALEERMTETVAYAVEVLEEQVRRRGFGAGRRPPLIWQFQLAPCRIRPPPSVLRLRTSAPPPAAVQQHSVLHVASKNSCCLLW